MRFAEFLKYLIVLILAMALLVAVARQRPINDRSRPARRLRSFQE